MSAFYYPLTLGVAQRRSRATGDGRKGPGERRPSEYEVWREGVECLPADVEYVRQPEARVLDQLQHAQGSGSRLWLVLGEPGAGKSTLLRAWFTRWASHLVASTFALGDAVPVLARLGELDDADWKLKNDAFADRLWQHGAECRALLDASGEGLGAWLYDPSSARRGRLFTPVWLLDGLDEVRRVPVDDVLLRRLANLPGRKVISCRVAAYDSVRAVAEPYRAPERTYELLGLTPGEQRAFLTQALDWDQTRADALLPALSASIRPLAANPLMLALIAQVRDPAQLPATRAGFYREAVKQMWHDKVGATLSVGEDARLARRRDQLLEQAATALGMHDVAGELGQLYDLGAAQGPEGERAVELVLQTGLLRVDRRAETFAFEHLTFQEYYLARALCAAEFRETLEHHWASPRYEETLALLIALRVEARRGDDVATGLRWLVEWGEATHHKDPKQLWKLGRSPLRTVLRLLGRAAVPLETMPGFEPWLWAHLARSRLPGRMRLAVAHTPILPPEVLARLAADPDSRVRGAVAIHPSSSAEVLRGLAKDPDRDVREQVASYWLGPADLLDYLAADSEPTVRRAVARHPWTSAEVLAVLALDPDSAVRQCVASNRSASAEVLTRLAEDSELYVRSVVAENPSASKEILARLVADPEPNVRFWVAMNPSASPEVLARSPAGSDSDVGWADARNLSASGDVLTRLAANPERLVRKIVAENPSAPPDLLAHLAADAAEIVRVGVAANPSASTEALTRLAADPEHNVRVYLALNPSAPAEVLGRLAADSDSDVRWADARNRSASADVLTRLATDPERQVRGAVAFNSAAPTEVLAQLATDSEAEVRREVAGNSAASADVLAHLAADSAENVWLGAVCNPGFLLEDLAA